MATNKIIKYTQLFINNEFVNSLSGKTFPTYNPATEEEIAQVQEANEADVDLAVKAARKAFEIGSAWRSMDPSARGLLINKFAQLWRRDEELLAKLETLNCGKPYNDALGDIDFSIKCMEYYAGWTDKIFGKTIPVDGPYFTYTRHEPIGVCGQIIPWNYPILMIAWKFGPALACGNTIVLKPAEQTPLTALHIASLAVEAGFPPGVINVVPGYGATAGSALAHHLDVNKVAFTGSTIVGRKIQEASAKSNLKRVSLELGGKSPFIIFDIDDEGLERAAEDTANSIFQNQGQSCCASSRIFVHEKVHDSFVEKLKKIADSKVVGDPFDENTTNGSVISELQFNKILNYIKSGKEEGAKVVAGGERVGSKGYFVRPTIFVDVKDGMKIAKEEIFGPVVSVFKFSDVAEVLKRANGTTYGLAAGIYSNDINKCLPLAHALEAGSVWINCYEVVSNQAPFGGFKQSGFGRELGEYGLHEYTEVKNVTIRLSK
jgi:acyl-CoA reductase-like NAD-dependent aldehyde dehydrogenase